MNTATETTPKQPQKQSLIRWNAIIPFLIISTLFYLYFIFFFDLHMKNAIEWVGYKALGAEVNVGEFKSSFIKGRVEIKKIELTDKEKPEFNSLELGNIRFDLNWDALLRVKFVIEEIAVEGVQFESKRAHIGKVAPPEPPSNEPSFTQQLQNRALNKLENENDNNILGDTAQFLKTGKFDAQIADIQSQIASKKMLEDMNAKWKAKQTEWDAQLKTLPTSTEMNAFKDRFGKIKFKDFANLQELDASVKEADSLIKDIDVKTKQVAELKSQFDADIKNLDQDYKAVDLQIKKDIDTIKSRFKIPKIDAKSFAKELFMSYLTPYMQKLDKYKALAEKYLPPKYARLVAGKKSGEVDDTIQPIPRREGVSYEFPVEKGYPLFWIQRVSVSSKSNAQADYGDVKGLISNITSNQRQIGKPTSFDISGEFNKQDVHGLVLKGEFSNIKAESEIGFTFNVGSYPINEIKLINSKDGQISLPSSHPSLTTEGQIVGFKTYDLKLANVFKDVKFNISSADSTINEVLQSTLGTITQFDLQASAKGELKSLDIDIRSSLGGDLEKAFTNLLQNKIKEANEKLQTAINAEVGKLKAQLDGEVQKLKTQADGEIKKVQAQVDAQKKAVEDKVAQAKKDVEDKANAAKKKAEDDAKSKVQQEGQKQLDDLKKKFKF